MAVAWSADGKWVATGLQNGRVVIWDTSNGQQKFSRLLHSDAVNCLTFHPNSEFLASGSDDGFVKMLNTTCQAEL